ncbi:MAG: response regulator, partial [Cyanobacteriota bacterium]|nr:response regulator [Cyanobacteriota bacterium]
LSFVLQQIYPRGRFILFSERSRLPLPVLQYATVKGWLWLGFDRMLLPTPLFMSETQQTILIIDDSSEDRETYRRYLLKEERYRYTIFEEEYGESGLELARMLQPDAILLDFSLPDMDGLECLKQLRSQKKSIHLPVIMLTGQGNEEIAVAALKNGAQDYLVKDRTTSENLRISLRGAIERAHLGQQLERSEARFRRLVESNVIGIFIGDLQGRLSYANYAFLQMLGYERDDIQKGTLRWRDLAPPEYALADEQAVQQLRESGMFAPFETEYQHKDGSRVPVLLGGALLEEEEESAIAFVIDISDRKAAEQNMRRALEKEKELNELKSHFVSMVSHEFRNPLTTISGGVQMLLHYADRLNADKKQNILQHIYNAVTKMLELLEDVLIIARSGAGKLKLEPTSFDLEAFCQQLSEELRMGIGAKHEIELVYQGQRNATLDRKLLRYILTNILSNAFKYSPDGSSVRFEVNCQPREVLFRIQDRGVGIPERDRPKLFQSFQRASNVGNVPGTGLGLAIAKQCLDLHGGWIAIDSELSAGTTVAIALPSWN